MGLDKPPQWPNSYGSVYRRVLPQQLIQQILHAADRLASCPNYWLPQDSIVGRSEAESPAEEAIRQIYWQCMQHLTTESIRGAEWWVQVYEPGKGLAFHFDKDETLFKEKREMRHPHLSSVLYLTGSADGEPLGPTVIIDQQFNNSTQEAVPQHPERSVLVWPLRNSLCVFDGRLGHGVLDSAAAGPRVTMLINWWTYQPQAVHVPPRLKQHEQEHSVHDAAEEHQLQHLSISSPVDDGCQPSTDRASCGSAATEELMCCQAATAVIRLPPSEELQAVTVDDLMESYNLTCKGAQAVPGVAIEHRGYHLYPVSCDQGELFEGCATAAALVPRGLLEEIESDDEA